LSETVVATATGSPVLGFGSTRDVQGSFASIAGGSRPDCPACTVPPLGTQGQIWLVIFSQGFVGLLAFLGFYVSQLAQHWRSRTSIEAVGVCLLLFFGLQMFVYDTLGMPMYTLMIAIGLMVRERARMSPRSSVSSMEAMWARVRRSARLILVMSLLGGILGAAVAWRWTPMYDAKASVLLAPSPLYLDLSSEEGPKEITIDTEASMVFSEQAIGRVRDELGLPASPDVRESIRVTAPPNSRVLEITVRDDDPARAEDIANAVALAYLEVRDDYLSQRRDQVREQIEQQLDSVAGRGLVITPGEDDDASGATRVLAEDELRAALTSLSLVSTEAGEVLRPAVASSTRKQAEVPIVSGVLLGALAGLGIMSWHDAGRSSGADRRRSGSSPERDRHRAEA
jgi:hypothetical protein